MMLRRVLAACGAVLLLAHLLYWLPNHASRDTSGLDVPGYYEAAGRVVHRAPLYDGAVEAFYSGRAPYIYPPPLAVALSPLARLSASTFQAMWYALVLVGFWCYAAGLVRLFGARVGVANVLGAGFLLQFAPGIAMSMSLGNADAIVWAMCAWSLRGGGALAGFAGALKVFPGWSLLAKSKRDVAIGVAVAAATCAATLTVVPLSDWSAWVKLMTAIGAGGMAWHTNISLPALLGVHGLAPMLALVAIAIPLRSRLSPELGGAVLLVLALWLSPICWWHYAPVLLMPLASACRVHGVLQRHARLHGLGDLGGVGEIVARRG
jgi:hypothetical protein